MNVYITSSSTTEYGSLGRGHYNSKHLADKWNIDEAKVKALFTAMIQTGQATDDILATKEQAVKTPVPSTPLSKKAKK